MKKTDFSGIYNCIGRWRACMFFSVSLSHHAGICKEAAAYIAGSRNLHKLNDLNTEKNPSPAVTWTPNNVQSRHEPQEPHTTNQDGSFLCVLPYLNISDFSWFRRFVFRFPIPPGTCKEAKAVCENHWFKLQIVYIYIYIYI